MADWLDFLTGVGSLFADKDKTSSKTSENSSLTSEQAVTGSTTSKTNQTGTTTSTGTMAGTTSDSTSNFSKPVMDALNAAVTKAIGSGAQGQVTSALQGRLTQLQKDAAKPAFDVGGFVNGVVGAATANTKMDLESRVNGMLSEVGGSEGGNSMAALLGNRLRNDANAALAGVKADATAQGEAIRLQQQESLTSQIGAIAGDIGVQLDSLLGQAKGGTQTSTGKTNQTSTEKGTAKTTTDQKGTEVGVTQVKQQKTGSTQTKTKKGDLFSRIMSGLQDSNLNA